MKKKETTKWIKRALIIMPDPLALILSGKKRWEIRGRTTKIRGKIFLAQSGTGKIYGQTELVDAIKMSRKIFNDNFSKHRASGSFDPAYCHAWIFKNTKKFKKPRPYFHPKGAIIWVKL